MYTITPREKESLNSHSHLLQSACSSGPSETFRIPFLPSSSITSPTREARRRKSNPRPREGSAKERFGKTREELYYLKDRSGRMGLCSDLNDVSSDSIPILLLALLANCVAYLRALLCHFLQSMGIPVSRFDQAEAAGGPEMLGQVCSGFAGLIVLAEQLNLLQVFDFKEEGLELNCMVCLCRLRDGERVRKLGCSHLFHRGCLDGWFDLCNLNCPLCRAPLFSEDRLAGTEHRLAAELVPWFGTTAR